MFEDYVATKKDLEEAVQVRRGRGKNYFSQISQGLAVEGVGG